MVAILCLFAVISAQDEPKPVKPIARWVGEQTRYKKKDCLRIRNEKDWKDFWKEHTGKEEEPTAVDFKTQMALVLPYYSCCGGGQVGVTETRQSLWMELIRGACAGSHLQPVWPAITIVIVPLSKKGVRFVILCYPKPARDVGTLPAIKE